MIPPTTDPHARSEKRPPTVLITAGPTQEPIDAVRFIGNRSSGRVGIALADEAARRGWTVTLLLGPTALLPDDSRVNVRRFRTAEDLRALLNALAGAADVLIMAAAVADYRPKVDPAFLGGKFRRTEQKLTLELEPTPDLLAEVAGKRRPGQLLVGFALEPRDEMIASARAKLARKRVDMVVANPLETMDSPSIEATVIDLDAREVSTPGAIEKTAFASWLFSVMEARRLEASPTGGPERSTHA